MLPGEGSGKVRAAVILPIDDRQDKKKEAAPSEATSSENYFNRVYSRSSTLILKMRTAA